MDVLGSVLQQGIIYSEKELKINLLLGHNDTGLCYRYVEVIRPNCIGITGVVGCRYTLHIDLKSLQQQLVLLILRREQ